MPMKTRRTAQTIISVHLSQDSFFPGDAFEMQTVEMLMQAFEMQTVEMQTVEMSCV